MTRESAMNPPDSADDPVAMVAACGRAVTEIARVLKQDGRAVQQDEGSVSCFL
jgi:hypothetical protein